MCRPGRINIFVIIEYAEAQRMRWLTKKSTNVGRE